MMYYRLYEYPRQSPNLGGSHSQKAMQYVLPYRHSQTPVPLVQPLTNHATGTDGRVPLPGGRTRRALQHDDEYLRSVAKPPSELQNNPRKVRFLLLPDQFPTREPRDAVERSDDVKPEGTYQKYSRHGVSTVPYKSSPTDIHDIDRTNSYPAQEAEDCFVAIQQGRLCRHRERG